MRHSSDARWWQGSICIYVLFLLNLLGFISLCQRPGLWNTGMCGFISTLLVDLCFVTFARIYCSLLAEHWQLQQNLIFLLCCILHQLLCLVTFVVFFCHLVITLWKTFSHYWWSFYFSLHVHVFEIFHWRLCNTWIWSYLHAFIILYQEPWHASDGSFLFHGREAFIYRLQQSLQWWHLPLWQQLPSTVWALPAGYARGQGPGGLGEAL